MELETHTKIIVLSALGLQQDILGFEEPVASFQSTAVLHGTHNLTE